MKVTLITSLNERPDISRIMLNTFIRLKSQFTINGLAACTSQADKDLCDEYSMPWVDADNTTAGRKWNAVLNAALKYDELATHFLIMGDDDSISSEGFSLLVDYAMAGHDYVGFKQNYFVDTQSDKAHTHSQPHLADKLIGCGALISRKAIVNCCDVMEIDVKRPFYDGRFDLGYGKQLVKPKVGEYLCGYLGHAVQTGTRFFNLFPDKSNGLDHAREMRLTLGGYPPKAIFSERIHVTDFKSNNNIWPYDRVIDKFRGPVCSQNDAMWYMTSAEREYVLSLNKKARK